MIGDDVEIMDEYINKNNEEIKQYKKDLKIEINKLVLNEWKKITNKYKHRTELKNVKNICHIHHFMLSIKNFG
jgi:hypothetical protein